MRHLDTELGKNILRQDITHGAYKRKNGQIAWSFSPSPKSKYPVNILSETTGDQKLPAPEILENELAPNQPVKLLLSMYQYKNPAGDEKLSMRLDGVMIKDAEHIDYLGGNNIKDYGFGKGTKNLADFAKKSSHTDAPTAPAANSDASSNADSAADEDDPDIQAEAKNLFSND